MLLKARKGSEKVLWFPGMVAVAMVLEEEAPEASTFQRNWQLLQSKCGPNLEAREQKYRQHNRLWPESMRIIK